MENTAFPKVIITDRELALMKGIAKVLLMATNLLCRYALVCMTQSTNRISYFEQFPKKLRPYIHHIKDVQADGNCGFRAIAGLIGLGEDDWQQVRHNLLTELHSNVVHYVQLFGSQERVDELNSILSYFEPSPGFNHWMTMPDMGHLIASYY
ncbi:hypothetical protein CsSME_00040240 [Camellia sinensis var. sinensis]